MRARSQEYAQAIYALVDIIRRKPRSDQKRYGALCHRFPLIVRENGLAAALGFLAAKGGTDTDSPENLLLSHYASVLGVNNGSILRQSVIGSNLTEYRHLTRQALAAAEWFKRYAEAVLKVDATGTGEEEDNA